MEQQLEVSYGTTQTIRYLVNSIDDLRETTHTVLSLIKQNCEPEHYRPLKESITLSVIPMPQSLSSFILGFDVPKDLLERAAKPGLSAIVTGDPQVEAVDCIGFPEPEIHTAENWSHFSFDLHNLSDLFCALLRTMTLLQSGSQRFEYVNLKRRMRLNVLRSGSRSKGFRLLCKVPGLLQRK